MTRKIDFHARTCVRLGRKATEVMFLTPRRFEHFLHHATRRELEHILHELWCSHRKALEFTRKEARRTWEEKCS